MTNREPKTHGLGDLLPVLGAVAAVLALTSGLMRYAARSDGPRPPWSRIGHGSAVVAAPPPRIVAQTMAQSPVMSSRRAGGLASTAVADRGTPTPWTSPLYPQDGVTLWDRIRVSPPSDPRAFLLGSAIQLHAPATAAILRPRSGLPERYRHTSSATPVA